MDIIFGLINTSWHFLVVLTLLSEGQTPWETTNSSWKMLEMCLFVLRQEERSLGLSIWIILLTSSKRMRTAAIVNVKPWREYFYRKTRLIFKVKSLTLKCSDYDHYDHINQVKQMCANSFVK